MRSGNKADFLPKSVRCRRGSSESHGGVWQVTAWWRGQRTPSAPRTRTFDGQQRGRAWNDRAVNASATRMHACQAAPCAAKAGECRGSEVRALAQPGIAALRQCPNRGALSRPGWRCGRDRGRHGVVATSHRSSFAGRCAALFERAHARSDPRPRNRACEARRSRVRDATGNSAVRRSFRSAACLPPRGARQDQPGAEVSAAPGPQSPGDFDPVVAAASRPLRSAAR